MEESSYVRSQDYESFIMLSRNCTREKFGARNSFMQNLMDKENDGIHVRHLKHNKLLANVKKYMLSATRFAIKRKFDKGDKERLFDFLAKIEAANHSASLLAVAKEGVELLIKYKPQ